MAAGVQDTVDSRLVPRNLRGRPGINPFGFKTTYTVDGEVFSALKRMSRELGFDQKRARQRQHFFSESEAPPDREEENHGRELKLIVSRSRKECHGYFTERLSGTRWMIAVSGRV